MDGPSLACSVAPADPDEAGAIPPAELPDDGPDGEGTPHLTLAGFSGPLHHLLTLARAQKIDLADISLAALADQLAAALSRAATTPLGRARAIGW